MKKIGLFAVALFTLCLVSCNQKKEQKNADGAAVEMTDSTKGGGQAASTTADSKDPEALLESYSSCVDELVGLMNKMKAGDASVATQWTPVLQKALEVSSQLDMVKDKLTPEQMKKFSEITSKLTEASNSVTKK